MTSPMPDLRQLTPGDRLHHTMLVKVVDQRETRAGLPYLILTLANATGELSANVWSEQLHEVAGIKAGDVVQAIGTIELYQGKRQLKLETAPRILPRETVDWRQLVPAISEEERERLWKQLDERLAQVKGPRLRAVLERFFRDDDFRLRFEACPASTSGHHAHLGGLLRHVHEVAAIAVAMGRTMRADQDLLFAGALLHDIGKIEAYSWHEARFGTTEAGAALGHVALGALMLERALMTEPMPCTARERLVLQHFILSHHGRLEYGAAVRPATLEAELLHFADDASAKGASFADLLSDPSGFDGDAPFATRGNWTVDNRKVWRSLSDWGRAES